MADLRINRRRLGFWLMLGGLALLAIGIVVLGSPILMGVEQLEPGREPDSSSTGLLVTAIAALVSSIAGVISAITGLVVALKKSAKVEVQAETTKG